jgi:hypothetical protein
LLQNRRRQKKFKFALRAFIAALGLLSLSGSESLLLQFVTFIILFPLSTVSSQLLQLEHKLSRSMCIQYCALKVIIHPRISHVGEEFGAL